MRVARVAGTMWPTSSTVVLIMSVPAPVLPAPLLAAITAAPHRVMFFLGAANVLAAMAWWAASLGGLADGVVPGVAPVWLHALTLQYQVLPSFIFGFLLTVFPRWMGLREPTLWHYLPVGLGLFSGQALVLVAAWSGHPLPLHLGWLNTMAGWAAALCALGAWLYQSPSRNWHAISCFAALLIGFAGLTSFGIYLHVHDARYALLMVSLGGFGLLVPIYATVAHRMFPFFAANAVPGYVSYRPMWALAAIWAACVGHLVLDGFGLSAWRWLADVPLTAVSGWLLWKWWPRAKAPPLLSVLFTGFAWLPLAMALYSLQSLMLLIDGSVVLGRAPLHAVAIGFFGSLLVAMVTRVTQGHSGRPLVLGGVAAFAFIGMQVVVLMRILAEFVQNPRLWLLASALGWLLVFLPWVLRSCWIYLTPRADGRPG